MRTNLLICGLLMLLSCQEEGKNTMRHDSKGYSFEEAKVHLDDIAKEMASDPSWVTRLNSEPTLKKRLSSLSTVELGKALGDEELSTMWINGKEHTVSIGLVNPGTEAQMAKFSSGSMLPIGVGVDPDEFGPENDVPIYVYDGENGTSQTVYINLPYPENAPLTDEEEDVQDQAMENAITALNYPVFVVTTEETYDDPIIEAEVRALAATQILSKNGGTAPYVMLHQIKLRKRLDDWFNDEHEIYIGESFSSEEKVINSTTIHKFNGKKRKDIAGRNVKYPDVDQKDTYTPDSTIALWPLSNQNIVRIVSIEDDEEAGRHHTSSGGIRRSDIRYYNFLNKAVTTENWKFNTKENGVSDWRSDEIYVKSGVDFVTEGNLGSILNGRTTFDTDERVSGYLKHVKYSFGLRYF